MATGILTALTIVLIAAACYVGLLLVRRSRPATPAEQTQTVGDLVRQRSAPDDVQGADDVSGTDLFTPRNPKAVAAPPTSSDDAPPASAGPNATETAVPHPTLRPTPTPPGGVEVGDAPWRRAARMMGSEPGAAWETAPIPVVPDAVVPAAVVSAMAPARATTQAADRAEAGRTTVLEVPASVVAEQPGRTAVVAVPEQADPEPVDPQPVAAQPVDAPSNGGSDAPLQVDPPRAAPAIPAGAALEVADGADVPAASVAATDIVAAEPTPADTAAADAPPNPDAPSRPLSVPDLTPLMGIPLVRPLGESPVPPPPVPTEPQAQAQARPVTQPVTPRLSRRSEIDDEVVSMTPASVALPPRAAVTGSPQPVWFRVVRRDGDPVGGVLVSLLDDRGQEADATKTATDGGGELHAPHGGWFLMIASADGFQPRAVTLAVEDRPVEIALLLPRSVTVAGVVREDGGAPAAGTRVVAFQEGEVVDDVLTDRDGGYRFDDLAEGVYALSATGPRGSAVGRVTLSEGADGQLDLDLRWGDEAR
ncbi:MAG: hypothetical protein QOK35_2852 [Pseudonocardiales bacterium]|nr:hypothetical protein [Pseudonocardiales bacterium]